MTPLAGVTVVDLTEGLAGPFACRLLAEAGANVLKVEGPSGDPTRRLAPAGFATWNRSKEGVVLDLTSANGRSSLDELLDIADVVVHGFSPNQSKLLGISDETLRRRHGDLIVATVTGCPRGHPDVERPAHEILVQASVGAMDEQQGCRPGPIFIRLPFANWCAAYLLAGGIVARLVQRCRTGVAKPIHTSLLQGALAPASLYWQTAARWPAGMTSHTLPKIWPGAALSLFECADDKWIQLAGATGGWIDSDPVIDRLDALDSVHLMATGVTEANRAEWQAVFRTVDSTTWLDRLTANDVPCMPVQRLGECFAGEQAQANGYVVEVDDPIWGRCVQAGPPIVTDPPSKVCGAAPLLGQSSVSEQIRALRKATESRDFWDRGRPEGELPLSGLRVLDFGTMVAGPFGAQCLSDLGADVIKVEPPDGDRGRTLNQFTGSQRGKRSLAVDLKHDLGRKILKDLLRTSDVVIHNVRLGAAGRLGIDEASIRQINPNTVFSHVSANGTLGPQAGFPGYDPTAQAVTGWELANAGEGNEPYWLRNSIMDVEAGLAAFVGTLFSLYHRERTGRPGSSSVSLLSVGMNNASETVLDKDGAPSPVLPIDSEQTGVGLGYQIVEARDGWVAIAATTEKEVDEVARVLGFGNTQDGTRRVADSSVDDLLARLEAAGVPSCRVRQDYRKSFFADDTNRRLGLARTLATADYGEIEVVGGYWVTNDADKRQETIPALGEHSTEILTELGYRTEELTEALSCGAVRQGQRMRATLEGAEKVNHAP